MVSRLIILLWQLQYNSCPSLQKVRVTHRASRDFENHSQVGFVLREEYTAREQLLMS